MLVNLQENLLTLLTFDTERASIIRGVVDLSLYGGPYRVVASRIYAHLDSFKRPPNDHLADILADKLDSKTREAGLYTDIITSIHSAQKNINAVYVMSQLELFIERQSMRSLAVELHKNLQRDTEESLEEAKRLIAGAHKTTLTVFDPGTRLSDKRRALDFLNLADGALPTGIPELDRRGLGPTRKELSLFIGNTSAGKSWWLGQLAKAALMQRLRVSHITLEMSEGRAAQRYFQALFSIAKRDEPYNLTKFKRDTLGRINDYDVRQLKPRLTFDDPNIRKKLERRIDRWGPRLLENIIIKEFPTGALTIRQLIAYLDNLETTEKFVPDLLIVDYPDLMQLDKDNFRLSLDQIFKELRGIGVARNVAVAVVSQSHRAAAKAKQVGLENVAEAYAKNAHSDTVITYNQTDAELKLGLARLHVAKGRNDQDKFTVAISQSYTTGQFVVDSVKMAGSYWENLPNESP